jgi:hypothetical protein
MHKRVLKWMSSLWLTVILLALGIVLVFFGTLGQVTEGLYLAQERYFKSWFTTWYPASLPWFHVPLPGGYLLGTLLVVNLLAAHWTRFKWTWKKSGIFLTHIGVLMLLLGQLATDMLSVESQMSFREGESRNYTEDFHKNELVFVRRIPGTDREQVVSIPEARLTRDRIQHEALPFSLRVVEYHENADVERFAPMVHTNRRPASTAGMGARLLLEPLPPARDMNRRNLPAVVLDLEDGKDGQSLGTWLASGMLRPDTLRIGEEEWRMELRPLRYQHPFSITLLKTTHEVYPGTERPKNFQSRVQIDRPDTRESRQVDIYMNNPLRYAGLTFFQYQMGREQLEAGGRGTSTLQVVRNPSWLTPYIACLVVGAGLTVQFSIHLVGFLVRRTPSSSRMGGSSGKPRNAPGTPNRVRSGEPAGMPAEVVEAGPR